MLTDCDAKRCLFDESTFDFIERLKTINHWSRIKVPKIILLVRKDKLTTLLMFA